MSDGHRTTCIQRPRDATRASLSRDSDASRESAADPSRFAEFTRPIAKDKQLVKGRGKRLAFALVAVVIAAALIASLFVLPVKSWLQQRDDLARKQNELAVLNNANAQLAADVSRLQTPDGIKEAARQEVGMVGFGEQRISVLTTPNAPLTLPVGWPYDAVAQIIAVRAAAAAATPAPAVDPALPATTAVPAPTP
ncbi:MAG TPA: septum formation initiator family protein [Ilumatobacteraceae bacterium]|nr:septum formation initiator family protein [Ilumatobacteraceae bacterium]